MGLPLTDGPKDPQARMALVTEGTLRIAPLQSIPALLAEQGVSAVALLAEAGIDPGLFAEPENTIAVAALGRLLDLCVTRTGNTHFGLLVGQQAGAASLGLVGLMVRHAPDVGSALRNLVLHLHLHDRAAIPFLSTSAQSALLAYSIYHPDVPGTAQIADGAIAIAFNIMKTLCGPDWRPAEVRFCHPAPDDTEPYRRFFKAPLRFEAEQTALTFPATWLDHRLSGSDPLLTRILEDQVAAIEAQGGGDIKKQMRRILRRLVRSGQVSCNEAANLFAIHQRTLNRRLKAQGTSFQELVDEVRYEMARQLLQQTRLPIVEIALALHYADATAFTRAFRRWSGTTPTAWRAARPRC